MFDYCGLAGGEGFNETTGVPVVVVGLNSIFSGAELPPELFKIFENTTLDDAYIYTS